MSVGAGGGLQFVAKKPSGIVSTFMNHSTEGTTNQTQARALLADIDGVSATALPRRDTIVRWLNAYLDRSSQTGYVMGETEAADLIALDQFLRAHGVPVAGGAAA